MAGDATLHYYLHRCLCMQRDQSVLRPPYSVEAGECRFACSKCQDTLSADPLRFSPASFRMSDTPCKGSGLDPVARM